MKGNNIKNIALNKWSYINSALNELLSWDNISGYHVISEKVTGSLYHQGKVSRVNATRIGIGAMEYAKGDR